MGEAGRNESEGSHTEAGHGFVERFLAMSNPVFGRGIVAFFPMPEDWQLIKSRATPDCLGLRDACGERWVSSGQMWATLLVREGGEERPYTLETLAESFSDERRAERYVEKSLKRVQGRRGLRVEGSARREHEGHWTRYLIWTWRARSLLTRREKMEAGLDAFIYCGVTRRVLRLKLRTPTPAFLLADAEALASMIVSIRCHEPPGI